MSASPPVPASVHAGRGFLFLLAHMRSQSSLLAHQLASHPEIAGHSELHRRYETRADLSVMRVAIEAQLGAPVAARWLVDKVLHDQLQIDPGVLARNDVRAIVLLRRPEASIASIVRMAREHVPGSDHSDAVSAATYYINRLGTLASYVPALAPRLAFVASEALVESPDEVLAGLSRWLGLARPLASTYRTFPTTGLVGHGDPSAHILAGRVLADAERTTAADDPVAIPEAVLRNARAAYDGAVARLASWAV